VLYVVGQNLALVRRQNWPGHFSPAELQRVSTDGIQGSMRLAPVRRPRGQNDADDEHRHSRHLRRATTRPATRYSQSMDCLAIIRDLGWAVAIALLIAIAGNYVAALL
jgi:hypothetical protein